MDLRSRPILRAASLLSGLLTEVAEHVGKVLVVAGEEDFACRIALEQHPHERLTAAGVKPAEVEQLPAGRTPFVIDED